MITARETEGGWLITFPSVAFGGDEECALDDFEGRKNGIRLVLLPQSQYRVILEVVDKARSELGELVRSLRAERRRIRGEGSPQSVVEAQDGDVGLLFVQSRKFNTLRLIVAHAALSFAGRVLPSLESNSERRSYGSSASKGNRP